MQTVINNGGGAHDAAAWVQALLSGFGVILAVALPEIERRRKRRQEADERLAVFCGQGYLKGLSIRLEYSAPARHEEMTATVTIKTGGVLGVRDRALPVTPSGTKCPPTPDIGSKVVREILRSARNAENARVMSAELYLLRSDGSVPETADLVVSITTSSGRLLVDRRPFTVSNAH